MLAEQSRMTFFIVLLGVASAGLCAWTVNKLWPERYPDIATADMAAPINFNNLDKSTNIANLERGRSYYAQLCMQCHGGKGDGKGEWAYRVSPLPVDLRSDRTRARSDQQLFDIISEGLIGTPMAGLKQILSPMQRWQIVEYLRHITPNREVAGRS
jgi:mono/diheme cytochrome c family protein